MQVACARRRRATTLSVAAIVTVLGVASAQPTEPSQVEIVDGGKGRIVTSGAATVAELLEENGVVLGPDDLVVPSPDTPVRTGLRITVFRAIPVRVVADGEEREVRVVGRTVADVLARAGVTLGPKDKVFPGLWREVGAGDRVRVVRIREVEVVRRRTVPFRTIRRVERTVFPRPPRLLAEGRPGLVEEVYRVVYADGQQVSKDRVAQRTLRPSQPRVVQVYQPYVPSRGELARRPSLVVVATAYAPYHGRGVDGVTATGLPARRGVVAVDPRLIPLGSIVFVEGYGVAVAADTGGAIRGRRVDLCFDRPQEAYRWGRRTVRVYILRRGSD